MNGPLAGQPAREVWKRIETLHAVTYFAPESTEAAANAGLRGFWMGYFGFRAAPVGPVGPAVVGAMFANFAPEMVSRAIPDAWTFADPDTLIERRAAAAATALRRCAPSIEGLALTVDESLRDVIDAASPLGRPLFAANRVTCAFGDPVARLWQSCATLREHRGDGHVAALVAEGIDGCQAHLLLAADRGIDPAVFLQHRGWSASAVDEATGDLARRGLLLDAVLTPEGVALRSRIEDATDRAASAPYDTALGLDGVERLIEALTATASQIVASGVLPFPNPMGLPVLDS